MSRLNALDLALVKLTAASTALERTAQPKYSDVKEAEGHAKAAHKILQASMALLDEGAYTVAQEPPEEVPLFSATGDPAPGAAVEEGGEPASEDAPAPAPSHPLDGLSEDDALAAFGARLDDAEQAWVERGGKLKTWTKTTRKAWMARFDEDRIGTWNALVAALETPGWDLEPPKLPSENVLQQLEEFKQAYPLPDFENTPQVDLFEAFEQGPLAALAPEIKRCEPETAEQLVAGWRDGFRGRPCAALWNAALMVLADSNLALACPETSAPAPAEGAA